MHVPRYSLADLKRAAEALPPGGSLTLPREALLDALSSPAAPPKDEKPDRLLTVREAAHRLGVSPRFVYNHAGQFPFTRRLSPKAVRFSERGLEQWLARTK